MLNTRLQCPPREQNRAASESPTSPSDDNWVKRPPSPLEQEIEGADALIAPRDIFPVEDLPESGHPVFLLGEVLEVVGVLPHVEHEHRNGTVAGVALVIVDLLHNKTPSHRFPRHGSPSRTLDVERRILERSRNPLEH